MTVETAKQGRDITPADVDDATDALMQLVNDPYTSAKERLEAIKLVYARERCSPISGVDLGL